MKNRLCLSSKNVVRVMTIFVMIALLVGIGFAGKAAYADANKTVETKVGHISDAHVMPMSYCNTYSNAFKKASVTAAKLMSESEAALQTALLNIYNMEDAPTIVLMSGDNTSNGEYEANKRVAEILREFTKKMRTRAGYESFQIFVMPGNHDLYNDGAVTYMPTEEELASCADDEERMNLITNYTKKGVPTTTVKDAFDIYSDFGYCNCPGRKAGHHESSCGMAEGTVLNFFYESEYWYDNTTSRTVTGGETVYTGFDTMKPTDEAVQAYKDNGKDFEYLAEAGRIGACSYVATLNGVTVIGVDGNAREYVGIPKETDKKYIALESGDGWNETTGGMVTRNLIRWIVDETKDEVEDGNLMVVNCHFNNIPHFDAQDEVISLFVLDNYEQYNRALSDAGIHYSFSGHQHSLDITDTVTQNGNVLYDFETGSLISYGSAYRVVDFKQVWDNGKYTEEAVSNVYPLDLNSDDGFNYALYKPTSALTEEDEIALADYVDSTVFTDEENVNLYPGTEYLTLVKCALVDEEGNKIGLKRHLTDFFTHQLTGVAGNFVNDGLYDMLRDLTSGLEEKYGYLYNLVGAFIDGLSTMDLPAFEKISATEFRVGDKAVAGNDLVDVAEGLVDYLFGYDFSYGQVKGGVTLTELFVELYGGHLAGVATTGPSENVQPLIDKLNDGTFVHFLVDLLANSIIPVVDFLFDAPIRYNADSPALPEGVGFDISEALSGSASALSLNGVVKMILTNYAITPNGKDYTSLKEIVGNVVAVAEDLLITDVEQIEDETLAFLADLVRGLAESYLTGLDKYIYMGIDYVNEYMEDGKILNVLNKELIDKYVTDAFCRNLGNYAAYIIGSIATDDTPDGGKWVEGDRMKDFTVDYIKDFNVTSRKSNASSVLNGKAFVRSKGGALAGDKLAVVPTEENGLLPSMITVSFNKDLGTEKKVQWFTSIDRDIFDKNEKGEYEFSTPVSYIEYSTNKDMSGAKRVEANTVNIDWELPTIDLGILYFNMSHRYRLYNKNTVTLTGLEPGTTYYYRLGNDAYAWTDVYSFTTMGKGAFSFMAITDIQGSVEKNYIESYPDVKKGVDSFGDREIAFIASMGDNVDNGKSVMQYAWWLDDQKDVWSNNTLVTLAGNHEKKEYSLSKRIALPDDATVNATGYYYSYDYNYAHFIILDTNDLTSANELSEKQTEWLLNDLKENEANKSTTWTIVMLHKGPYTAGSHAFDADVIALRKQLTPIFAENGVDLVLQGHDHTYSVSEYIGADGKPVEVKKSSDGSVTNPKGVLYVNLGTMGDKYYNYLYSDEVSLVKRSSVDAKLEKYLTEDGYLELTETPVFADITVDKGVLSVKTYTIVDGETVLVDDITIKNKKEGMSTTTILIIVGVVVGAAVLITIICVAAKKKGKKGNKIKSVKKAGKRR